jgi:hypothetical protein
MITAREVAMSLLEMGSIEMRSNREHLRADGHQSGPDPEVQRELRNQGVLHRAASAANKPRLSRLRNRIRKLH